jgi:inosine-uridine nucleoside N-ribohydrolase
MITNISIKPEFNVYADPVAAARVYALTSQTPEHTLPPTASNQLTYPTKLPNRLPLTILPLDITTPHSLFSEPYYNLASRLPASPIANWTTAFLRSTFVKLAALYAPNEPLSMHDPLTIWYLLTQHSRNAPAMRTGAPVDVRIETEGAWTKGSCVVDKRPRNRIERMDGMQGEELVADEDVVAKGADEGGWLGTAGNAVQVVNHSAWKERFGEVLVRRIFGLEEE